MSDADMITRADSSLVAALHASPNIEARRNGMTPSMLVLHYTGLPCVEKSIEVLSRPDCKVSCHYVVADDGTITQMVPESARAWHAGVSSWHGERDLNSASIGIEIQNPGHNDGYPDFPAEQMDAVTRLCQDIIARHGIVAERVLGHSDIAPGRKIDPGEKFDWEGLHRAGVGHWVKPMDVDPADRGFCGRSQGPEVLSAQTLLARYGYGIEPTGIYSPDMEIVVAAFQRHFRPARVDGRLDLSTYATLQRLVQTVPAPAVS